MHALRSGHPDATSSGLSAREEQLARTVSAYVATGRPLGPLSGAVREPGYRGVFHDDGPAELSDDFRYRVHDAFTESAEEGELANLLLKAVSVEFGTPDLVEDTIYGISTMSAAVGREQLGWTAIRDRLISVLGADATQADVVDVSYGVSLWLNQATTHAAGLLAADAQAVVTGLWVTLEDDLDSAAAALSDAAIAWQLELDGTMDELTRAREEFSSDPSRGPEIGVLARRALLLDARLRAALDPRGEAAPLSGMRAEQAGVRQASETEADTRRQLPDDERLLAPADLSLGVSRRTPTGGCCPRRRSRRPPTRPRNGGSPISGRGCSRRRRSGLRSTRRSYRAIRCTTCRSSFACIEAGARSAVRSRRSAIRDGRW